MCVSLLLAHTHELHHTQMHTVHTSIHNHTCVSFYVCELNRRKNEGVLEVIVFAYLCPLTCEFKNMLHTDDVSDKMILTLCSNCGVSRPMLNMEWF